MFTPIREKIEVAGVYQQGIFIPKKINWRGQVRTIKQITLTSNIRSPGIDKRVYGVVIGNDVYRIEFDRKLETWQLKEVYCD